MKKRGKREGGGGGGGGEEGGGGGGRGGLYHITIIHAHTYLKSNPAIW